MTSQILVQVLIGLVGSGGLGGAVYAFLKWKPDATSAAVTDAQGAAAEWKKIAEEYEQQRNYWRGRALRCEREHGDSPDPPS